MNKRLLLSTAIAIAASAGAAQAGSGPAIQFDLTFTGPYDSFVAGDLVVDFARGNGGFQILSETGLEFGSGFWINLTGRLYRTFGNITIGPYVYAVTSIPTGAWYELGFGWDFAYQRGKLTIYNDNWYEFDGAWWFNNNIAFEYAANDRLTLGGNFFIELPGPEIDLYGWAGLDFGVFSPYVFVDWSPTDPHLGVGIGNSIDLPLGDTPLSLIGKTEFAIGTGGPAVFFNIGIRYSHDKVNTPWWWDYYY